MHFLERIHYNINANADRNAFYIQGKHYTYNDIGLKIAALQHLLNTSFATEERIGVVVNDSPETYAAILAVLLAGKTYIPIHPGHPAERIAQITEQAGIKIILSTIEVEEYAGISNINMTMLQPEHPVDTIRLINEDIQDKNAYILFTSGTTGTPKGTPISYHNLQSFVTAFNALGYALSEHDKFLQMFDLTFDLSVMSYLIPMCLGGCVYTLPEKGMKYTNIYGLLEEHDITFALMVPSILSYLRPYFGEIELPALRYSLFCGEALLKDVVTEWAACAPNAVIENVYGPTEATIFCMAYRVNTASAILDVNGIVAIGKPMAGVETIIVDSNNTLVAEGEKGELCLHGGQVTKGYLSEEKNKEAFFMLNDKRYYRTGDIACQLEDGNNIYCGRVDHQVKIQGFRVELSEVEFHVRAVVNGPNAVALAINTTHGLNQIEVVIESLLSLNTEEVMSSLKTKLPPYMIPTAVHYLHPFPLNVNGKIDRKALHSIVMERMDIQKDVLA